jgi:UDP-GlcNAc3NAcA epimerase
MSGKVYMSSNTFKARSGPHITIVAIGGIRPHFVKLAALRRIIAKFNERSETRIDVVYINTGQHYDDELAGALIRELDLRFDLTLTHSNRKPIHILCNMIMGICEILEELEEEPDWVMVIGDANTSLAGAIAATKSKYPVIHVEAGTALGNVQSPEVINGKVIEQLATVYFCASKLAIDRLKAVGVSDNIFLVGDITRSFVIEYSRSLPCGYGSYPPGEYVLVTMHREENLGSEETMRNILEVMSDYHKKVLFVTHPRTRQRLQKLNLLGLRNIEYLPALPYGQMLSTIKGCSFLITDSGGLQREAYHLKKRCLVRSDVEFWPSLTQAGIHRLIGTDEGGIREGLEWMELTLASGEYGNVDDLDDDTGIEDALHSLVRLSARLAEQRIQR